MKIPWTDLETVLNDHYANLALFDPQTADENFDEEHLVEDALPYQVYVALIDGCEFYGCPEVMFAYPSLSQLGHAICHSYDEEG